MTREQHLLVCLAEECSEVQKEIMKILRFGLIRKGDTPHKTLKGREVPSNHESLKREVLDLLTVLEMLEENELLYWKLGEETDEANNAIKVKRTKVEEYMKYAHELGQLEVK